MTLTIYTKYCKYCGEPFSSFVSSAEFDREGCKKNYSKFGTSFKEWVIFMESHNYAVDYEK